MLDAPLASLATNLAAGRTTSAALVEAALDRISASGDQGRRSFTLVDHDGARAAARASDLLRAQGIVPSPLAGIPISIKDLFDVAGQVTTAGSKVLADAPPAARDAPVIARLRAAGAVVIGRTNMTEFAFSGLGINPHYGTPGNPFDPERIPGGSSSGAAVSVALGMAAAAVGSDTGGSVRIPAAFCGLAGFKPTQARIPRDGAVPLSWSLDTIGPIARTVACCALLDAVMAGSAPVVPEATGVAGLRLGVPTTLSLDGLDPAVAAAFARALDRLSQAGARITEFPMPLLERIPALNAGGGLPAPEAYAWHRSLLAERADGYDPRVRVRIERGAQQAAADYVELLRTRADLIAEAEAASRPFDALLAPTVAVLPPRFAELEDAAAYARINVQVLRNTSLWNFLDRPAASLPCAEGGGPIGLMVIGRRGHDRRLLGLARGIEPIVA